MFSMGSVATQSDQSFHPLLWSEVVYRYQGRVGLVVISKRMRRYLLCIVRV